MYNKKKRIDEAEELLTKTVTGKRGRGSSKKKTASLSN